MSALALALGAVYVFGVGFWVGIAVEQGSVIWWKVALAALFWPPLAVWALLADVLSGSFNLDRKHLYIRPWSLVWSEELIEKGKEERDYEGRHIRGRLWAFRRRRQDDTEPAATDRE